MQNQIIKTQGDLLKEQGISQVLSHTPEYFRDQYAAVFQYVLYRNTEICGETVRSEFNRRFPDLQPHHPNVWSAVFRANKKRAIDLGMMEEAHRHEKSVKPSSHSSNKPVYRSKVAR